MRIAPSSRRSPWEWARGSPRPSDRVRATEAERDRDAYRPVVTPISVEVGEGLAALVESLPGEPEAPLRALIPSMREALFHDLGVPFPGVRVRVLRGEMDAQRFVMRV